MLRETDAGEGCTERGGRVRRTVRVGVSSPQDAVGGLGLEARLGGGLTIKCVWEDDVLPVCA